MARTLQPHSHVVVVDSQPSGYSTLVTLAEAQQWHTHFLTSGAAAIHIARRLRAELWMLHVSLPDMSGFELCEMLREQLEIATTFMIANHYSADDERRSCGIGVHLYLCKELDQSLDCGSLLKSLLSSSKGQFNARFEQSAIRPP
jgi:DNA-binding response OmpR family regulator